MILSLLQHFDLTLKQAQTVHQQYGKLALVAMEENPYRLIHDVYGISFARADDIARRVGIAGDSALRLQSAVMHCIGQSVHGRGNTCAPMSQICSETMQLLQLTEDPGIENTVHEMVKERRLHVDANGMLYLPAHYEMECNLTKLIHELCKGGADNF